MDQPFGEQKHVPKLKGLIEELVGSVDEADLQGAADDEEEFGGAGVGVRRVEGAGGELEDGQGDALAEKGGELGEGGFCGLEIWREGGEGWAKACEGEESAVEGGVQWVEEIDNQIWVAGFGHWKYG